MGDAVVWLLILLPFCCFLPLQGAVQYLENDKGIDLVHFCYLGLPELTRNLILVKAETVNRLIGFMAVPGVHMVIEKQLMAVLYLPASDQVFASILNTL